MPRILLLWPNYIMHITLTTESIDWLRENHIFLDCFEHHESLRVGKTLWFEGNPAVGHRLVLFFGMGEAGSPSASSDGKYFYV